SQTAHGGLIISLTDTLGSLAVASGAQYVTDVSTDIGASFIKPAGRAGDVLHARATVTATGKSLAHTRVDFTSPTGDLVAYGRASFCSFSHTKYVAKPSLDSNNFKFSEDGETVRKGKNID
ncbi:hypothetical protein CONPUDRAFT_58584, partial [Coniophora puteana RWD-64-598 SS2]